MTNFLSLSVDLNVELFLLKKFFCELFRIAEYTYVMTFRYIYLTNTNIKLYETSDLWLAFRSPGPGIVRL